MRKLILFLLLSFIVSSVYAEMPGLEGYLLSNSSTTISLVHNYIVNKSSNYIWLEQQTLNYNTDISSASYFINFIIRLPLSKKLIQTEIKDKCLWFKNNYGGTIIKGYLKTHRCFNDWQPTGACEWIELWQKGY